MGYALAAEALRRGAVGDAGERTDAPEPRRMAPTLVKVRSAADMHAAVMERTADRT